MSVTDDELSIVRGQARTHRNVHFKDIDVTADKPPVSFLVGYDNDEHSVQNVTIENLRINGALVRSPNEGHFTIERAKGIRFAP